MTDTQRILDAIRRLVQQLRLFDRAAQSCGLSAAQLFVLAELGKHPEMSIGEVAERTRTDQSSVSTVVARVVSAGLVERQRDRQDARRVVLTLTDAGRKALESAPPVAQEVLLAILERLPAEERRSLAEGLTHVADGMGAEKVAPMLFEDQPARSRKGRRH